MKVVALIPARYNSQRFPGKLMETLDNGKTIIETTFSSVNNMELFDDVIVITDNKLIFKKIESIGGKVIMSKKNHQCGSDRIAEIAKDIDADIIVNVQGDEPFTKKEILEKLIASFRNDSSIDLASLKRPLNYDDALNSNNVKVITDINNNALYFSRSLIPFQRDYIDKTYLYYKHIGVYAFKKQALEDFSNYEQTPLEIKEKIECIRFLENGKKIKMVEVQEDNISIDTPEDLENLKKKIKEP